MDELKHLVTFFDDLPDGKRILALDIGKKTIGLAVSNADFTIATPLRTIQRIKFSKDVLEFISVIKDYEIGGYVIGLPLNIDGSEGGRAQASRHFADAMRGKSDIFGTNPPILFWDERYSTHSADSLLTGTAATRKKHVDALAAQIILDNVLTMYKHTR